MTTTIPFFLLIIAEISFLIRTILLTLWPASILEHRQHLPSRGTHSENEITQGDFTVYDYADDEKRRTLDNIDLKDSKSRSKKCFGFIRRGCCCFLRWNAKMILTVLNLLTLANPFFGCLLAWILLYRSDKTESFVMIGIECVSVTLHLISVRMEGGLRTWRSKLVHSVSIVPILVTIILVMFYIREGGVCYLVESEIFLFSGCEVCPGKFVMYLCYIESTKSSILS